MPASISLWFYRLVAYPDRGRVPVSLMDLPGSSFDDFLTRFVSDHSRTTQDDSRQRIWYFDSPSVSNDGEIDGAVKYGVFGFESDLTNSKTKRHRYKRQVDDYEQIDLYYQYWHPKNSNGALVTMQSFQGRSCISYLNQTFQEDFKNAYPGFTIRISKVMPADLKGSVFAGAGVKSLNLVARKVHTDSRRNYGSSEIPEEMDVSVRMTARKGGSFGPLGQINEQVLSRLSLPVWVSEVTHFDRAIAEIEWNGRRRKVGVFGGVSEAGGIDVTDDIVFGVNGHPTLQSVREQADDFLSSFAQALGYVR